MPSPRCILRVYGPAYRPISSHGSKSHQLYNQANKNSYDQEHICPQRIMDEGSRGKDGP